MDDGYELHLLGPPNSSFVNNFLTQIEGHGKQIWILNQSSMSIKLLLACAPIFQNLRISVHFP